MASRSAVQNGGAGERVRGRRLERATEGGLGTAGERVLCVCVSVCVSADYRDDGIMNDAGRGGGGGGG